MKVFCLLVGSTMLGRPWGRSLRYVVNTDSVAGDFDVQSAAHRLSICQQDPPSCSSAVTDMANQSEAMKDDVMNQMNRTQVDIDIIISGFATCGNLSGSDGSHRSAFADKVVQHTRCRQDQASKTKLVDTYQQLVRASLANKSSQCSADILTKPVADYQPICHPSSQVPLQQWFESMASQFSDLKQQWSRQRYACDSAQLEYTKLETESANTTKALNSLTCDTELAELESFACAWASQYNSRCITYESCYTSQVKQLELKTQTILTTINQWKNTWTAASKMECMGKAVSGSTVDDTKMKLCDAANLTNTSHITIVIPSLPPKQACPAPEIYPGSTQYGQMVYGVLPAGINVRLPTLCIPWKEGCKKHASFSESVVQLELGGKTCSLGTSGEVLCQGISSNPGLFVFRNADSNCNSGRGELTSLSAGKCRFDPALPFPSIRCSDVNAQGNPKYELTFINNPVATSNAAVVQLRFDSANGSPLRKAADWRGPETTMQNRFLMDCADGAMTVVNSFYDKTKTDRRFKYACSPPYMGALAPLETVSGLTQFGALWTFECPLGAALSSIESFYNNNAKERQYRFRCAEFPSGIVPIPGPWPDKWSSEFHSEQYDNCGPGVMVGISSIHNNQFEDRRWKFRCASVQFKSPTELNFLVKFVRQV